jgi:hypothetical protein
MPRQLVASLSRKREGFILSHPLSVFPYHYRSTSDPYSFFYILPLLQGQMVESWNHPLTTELRELTPNYKTKYAASISVACKATDVVVI